MTTRSLFRLTGAGVMLGAVLFVAGVSRGAPPPEVAPLPQMLVLTFAVLLLAGVPALYLRQREVAGVLGLVGAALVFVSIFLLAGLNHVFAFFVPGLTETAPAVLERFPAGEWQRLIAVNVAARVGLATGLVLFGIATYRAGVLPRWGAVVAVAGGLGAIVQILVVLLELPEPVGMVVLLLPIGLFALGWGLWSRADDEPTTTARTASLRHG